MQYSSGTLSERNELRFHGKLTLPELRARIAAAKALFDVEPKVSIHYGTFLEVGTNEPIFFTYSKVVQVGPKSLSCEVDGALCKFVPDPDSSDFSVYLTW